MLEYGREIQAEQRRHRRQKQLETLETVAILGFCAVALVLCAAVIAYATFELTR